jgi:DNA-binding CsgD family transcriptional regulator
MAGLTLTDKQLAAMRDVVDIATTVGDAGPALPWALLDAVRVLVGADEVELDQTDPQRRWLGFMQSLGPRSFVVEEPYDPHFWDLYWNRTAARIYSEHPGSADRVTLMSDFTSDRQWRVDPMYVDYARDGGIFHEIGVNLPEVHGRALRLHCWRGPGSDFTEMHRFVLTLLRPHLLNAYRHAVTPTQAARSLTPRQLELLGQVEQGFTNRQIARRLRVSEGTVRRHLNNVYERLGVSGRTAALAQVRGVGLTD